MNDWISWLHVVDYMYIGAAMKCLQDGGDHWGSMVTQDGCPMD